MAPLSLNRRENHKPSIFDLIRVISCGLEIVPAFFGREGGEAIGDDRPEFVDGSFGRFAEHRLEFGEGVFD